MLAPLADTRAFTDELAEFVLACERRLIGPEELLERARPRGAPTGPGRRLPLLYGEHLALQDLVDQAGPSSRPATCSRTIPASSPPRSPRWAPS